MRHPQQQQARQVALAVAACAGALLAWLGLSAGLLWATLADAERAQALDLLGPRGALLGLALMAALAGLAWAVPRAWRRWVQAPRGLLERARVLLEPNNWTPAGS